MIFIQGTDDGSVLASVVKEMEDERMRKRMENVPEPVPTEKEDRALKAAIAYTRYLKAKHSTWSAEKLQRRVAAHFNIKFV